VYASRRDGVSLYPREMDHRAGTCVVALALLAAVSGSSDEKTAPVLEPWSPGTLDIHQISTGRGNAAFFRFPDGTTLLVDAGDVGEGIPEATALPDASRGAGAWVARYIKRMAGADAVLDYALVTHFHPDHLGAPLPTARLAPAGYRITGIAEVAESVPIRKLIDRGFPDYGEPAAPSGAVFDNYRRFAEAAATRDTIRERIRVGRADQISMVRHAAEFSGFSVRAVAANGDVWTGAGDETRRLFPASAGLPEEDRPAENPCSIALRIVYGRFRYYTGGDLYGMPDPGEPPWQDIETPIAKAIGKTDVMVLNHHGSIEVANPFFLSALSPRVIVVPAWSPTHPSPDVLKRLMSKRIWPLPRDIFITRLRDATKAAIGPRATQVASDAGHVLVRVAPGGASYRVFVLDDTNESGAVKSVHGPYAPMAPCSPR
jgi:beta-lactamase superfamily II metal-dependent hydrolase